MSTYQAASGAGAAGMAELRDGVAMASTEGEKYVDGMGRLKEKVPNSEFAHPLAFNVIPHIDKFQANGYTKEEMKVTWECRKILGFPPILLNCATWTCLAQSKPIAGSNFCRIAPKMGCITRLFTKKDEGFLLKRL